MIKLMSLASHCWCQMAKETSVESGMKILDGIRLLVRLLN